MLRPDIVRELKNILPTILSIKETATFLRCSEMTIRRLIKEHELQAFFTDGEWNILREDLIKYLDKHSN